MNKNIPKYFPQRLKSLRIASRLTQKDLAKNLNISRSCLANYEVGKRFPDNSILISICDYFNVSTDYFWSDDSNHISCGIMPQTSAELIKTLAVDDKLDLTTISPLSKIALIEFYKFLEESENRLKNSQ